MHLLCVPDHQNSHLALISHHSYMLVASKTIPPHEHCFIAPVLIPRPWQWRSVLRFAKVRTPTRDWPGNWQDYAGNEYRYAGLEYYGECELIFFGRRPWRWSILEVETLFCHKTARSTVRFFDLLSSQTALHIASVSRERLSLDVLGYCGASVNALQVEEKNCNFPCNGNKTESCGGGKIISIYQGKHSNIELRNAA